MANLTYILILIISVSIPVIFSFENNFKFYKKVPKLVTAIAIGAIPYILWDLVFTDAQIWGFNESYFMGIKFFGLLPLEEVLFFFAIPYSCIFLHEAFYYHFNFDPFRRASQLISILMIFGTSTLAWSNIDRAYTFSAMLALSIVIFLAEFVFKNKELSRFYLVFLIITIPFAIDNGILTGSFISEPVVWYNDNENLGIRLGTIPFEDFFYGMSLVLLDFCIFKKLQD